ncbi:MAG: U32 family peptidase [Nitrospirae bacterium]|nr:U32 family peptidase [Nitrospirota bacterium]
MIIQDMGILEMDIPPIAVHASTQANNYSLDRIKFLDAIGVKRIVLARELSLSEISVVRDNTRCELESFVYGALCVSLSGQCYMSLVSGGRSANRGCCAQPCRNLYSLKDGRGNIISKERHLLSLKDMNRMAFVPELIKAGVTSFKIEGRLKDEHYVKNITAYFRKALDQELEKHSAFRKASSGQTSLLFNPDPEKTFHRGSTDYLLTGKRGSIALPETSKSTGKPVGRVVEAAHGYIRIKGSEELHNNDGLVFFDKQNVLRGLKVNKIEGEMIFIGKTPLMPQKGTAVYRNYDHEFLKSLRKDKSLRKIKVSLEISFKGDNSLLVRAVDEDAIAVENEYHQSFQPAQKGQFAAGNIQKQLSKSGPTPFYTDRVTINWEFPVFVPSSLLNKCRQEILHKLEQERLSFFRPVPYELPASDAIFPYEKLDFTFNVSNKLARRFYKRHGVRQIDKALEIVMPSGEIVVMTTKHCLKFELGLCVNEQKITDRGRLNEPLFLYNKDGIYKLRFNCKECFMHVIRV